MLLAVVAFTIAFCKKKYETSSHFVEKTLLRFRLLILNASNTTFISTLFKDGCFLYLPSMHIAILRELLASVSPKVASNSTFKWSFKNVAVGCNCRLRSAFSTLPVPFLAALKTEFPVEMFSTKLMIIWMRSSIFVRLPSLLRLYGRTFLRKVRTDFFDVPVSIKLPDSKVLELGRYKVSRI